VWSPVVMVMERPIRLEHIDPVGAMWALAVTTPPKASR